MADSSTTPTPGNSTHPTILVTGDVVVDHHIYVGEQKSATDTTAGRRQTFELVEFGGAAMIERLLRTPPDGSGPQWAVHLGLARKTHCYAQAFAIWEASPSPDRSRKDSLYWLATEAGYGSRWTEVRDAEQGARGDSDGALNCGAGVAGCPAKAPEPSGKVDVLVVDDAGAGFRDSETLWPRCLATAGEEPTWMVWKMAGDPGGGSLWQHIEKRKGFAEERLIVVVSASDLRRAGMDVTVGLSWERSALDVLRGLKTSRSSPLANCAHLIVSFPDAGALWITRRKDDGGQNQGGKREAIHLVYEPAGGEGVAMDPRKPKAFGYQACLVSGIVWSVAFASPGEALRLDDGLRRGLAARSLLFAEGHGSLAANPVPSGFPAETIRTKALVPVPDPGHKPSFAVTELPGEAPRGWPPGEEWPPADWTLAQQGMKAPGPFFDVAVSVAQGGLDVLPSLPRLKVGAYETIERREIEAIRRIRRGAREYDRTKQQKCPFSIAVFGAPGAGKSFIVKQLAKDMLEGESPFLEFNLSQFSDESDLRGAFHRVRDEVLKGKTPIVFWDEFDSQQYRWLRLLLAPMQDGEFRDGQIAHPIGKCIFIFAGGTSSTFDDFGEPRGGEDTDRARFWVMAKGPDFKSRIRGHLDVLGPNPRRRRTANGNEEDDRSDACYPIRRALFLRGCWRLGKGQKLDPKLVRALLEVPYYVSGSRSFERVLSALAEGSVPFTAAALPSAEDLAIDIRREDVPKLVHDARARSDWGPVAAELQARLEARLDEFAARINQAYMRHPREVRNADVTFAYDSLSLFLRESNRAAVRRIPIVLLAAGLEVVSRDTPGAFPSTSEALAFLKQDGRLDLAAEKEHEEWCRFHLARKWECAGSQEAPKNQYGDPPTHGLLVDWKALQKETDKNKDRVQVGHYVEIVYDDYTKPDDPLRSDDKAAGLPRFALRPVQPVVRGLEVVTAP